MQNKKKKILKKNISYYKLYLVFKKMDDKKNEHTLTIFFRKTKKIFVDFKCSQNIAVEIFLKNYNLTTYSRQVLKRQRIKQIVNRRKGLFEDLKL